MTDDGRGAASTLKGRLADVYVPALVAGSLDGLAKRLGNRATVDDPLHGRAASLTSLQPLIAEAAGWFQARSATYRHVYSTTGVDRDTAEGVLSLTVDGAAREVPIAVVAERRRLREIELRVYYRADADRGARKPRSPLVTANPRAVLPAPVAAVLGALKERAIDQALAAFEENARAVDPTGTWHHKKDGAMGSWLSDLGSLELVIGGVADDGRACCVEGTIEGGDAPSPALLSFERGDSGLFHELRFYRDA
jgi:hypothetical protein